LKARPRNKNLTQRPLRTKEKDLPTKEYKKIEEKIITTLTEEPSLKEARQEVAKEDREKVGN
jgi:hypothetical protein